VVTRRYVHKGLKKISKKYLKFLLFIPHSLTLWTICLSPGGSDNAADLKTTNVLESLVKDFLPAFNKKLVMKFFPFEWKEKWTFSD